MPSTLSPILNAVSRSLTATTTKDNQGRGYTRNMVSRGDHRQRSTYSSQTAARKPRGQESESDAGPDAIELGFMERGR